MIFGSNFSMFRAGGGIPRFRESFREAKPFPHIVMDNLWDGDEIDAVAASFYPPEDPRWRTYPDPREFGKRCIDAPIHWPDAVKSFIDNLYDEGSISDLEALTGIERLSADHLGGGMHLSTRGARLGMHRDFNRNGNLARRLNLLVFLTDHPDLPLDRPDGWSEPGGVLYLGNRGWISETKSKQGDIPIVPKRNRTVIFECGPASWHGHPVEIQTDWERKSIAVYYYSPLPEGWPDFHDTVWEGQ